MDRASFETLLATGIAEGRIAASLRSVHLAAYEVAPEVAATLLMDIVADGAVVAEEPSTAERGIPNEIASFASYDEAATALRVPILDLPRISETEQKINDLVAPLPAPDTDAPWRDYRPLSAPPEPWNDSHFERDTRRMQAAAEQMPDLELPPTLDRATWTAYAEIGEDAVTHLMNEKLQAKIDNLLRFRENLIAAGQTKIARQNQLAARAKAAEEERKRIERIQAEDLMRRRMEQPNVSFNDLPPLSSL